VNIPQNTFKTALQQNAAQIGLWVGLTSPYCAEICATAGFDWLLIDWEHSPNDLRSILAQLQAISAYSAHPIVRPPCGEVYVIKQLLDIGVQTLMIPMVESADYARQLVSAMRYPPAGIRGVGSGLARAAAWNGRPNYLHLADKEMCLLVQVETAKGIQAIEEIAAVEGVDGIFIGPSDLAASLGHLGQPGHPEVQETIAEAIVRIQRTGKAVGILSVDETAAKRYLSLGCQFVAVGLDTLIFSNAVRRLAKTFKAEEATK
jgi:4-hydroxy-2-oxoheptanedioate aldolase